MPQRPDVSTATTDFCLNCGINLITPETKGVGCDRTVHSEEVTFTPRRGWAFPSSAHDDLCAICALSGS
jgi:hypothetical protein